MLLKNKYPLLIALLALITIGLIFGVILPAVGKIKKADEQINANREYMEKLLGEGQSVAENQKNLAKIKSEMVLLDNIWLTTGEELKFITDLEKQAAKNNMEQTIIFDNTSFAPGTEIKIIPLGLEISGSLDNLLSYLADLEALDYYININQIEIRAGGLAGSKKFAKQAVNESMEQTADGDETILSVGIKATTYWK